MTSQRTRLALVLSLLLLPLAASADELVIQPDADATIYEPPPFVPPIVGPPPPSANGAGDYLFAGTTQSTELARRGFLRFNLAAVPPGSTIDAVELTLNMSRTIAGSQDVSLHRVTTEWTEGPTDPPGEEGQGEDPAIGDVTWVHATYNTLPWNTSGGDFVAGPSATIAVAGLGPYTWGSTTGLEADVQSWVDDPASNFGWILVGNEADPTTAKRFDSRENPGAGVQPSLRIVFSPAPEDIPTLDPRALAALAILLVLAGARLVSRR